MSFILYSLKTGAARRACSRFLKILTATALFGAGAGCTILVTRPIQLMSDTSAALRAAKEAQADTLAPELYRQANEWFVKAKQEYKFKNFDQATNYATRARNFAEQAEFQAIRNGARLSEPPPPPQTPAPEPYAYPEPQGTPVEPSMRGDNPRNSSNPPPPAGDQP